MIGLSRPHPADQQRMGEGKTKPARLAVIIKERAE
jgi:hypothetical protein